MEKPERKPRTHFTHAMREEIKELKEQLRQEKMRSQLEAFGREVFFNYGMMVVWNGPKSTWPEQFKTAYKAAAQKCPTLAKEWWDGWP